LGGTSETFFYYLKPENNYLSSWKRNSNFHEGAAIIQGKIVPPPQIVPLGLTRCKAQPCIRAILKIAGGGGGTILPCNYSLVSSNRDFLPLTGFKIQVPEMFHCRVILIRRCLQVFKKPKLLSRGEFAAFN